MSQTPTEVQNVTNVSTLANDCGLSRCKHDDCRLLFRDLYWERSLQRLQELQVLQTLRTGGRTVRNLQANALMS
jgi:hypothetical protein